MSMKIQMTKAEAIKRLTANLGRARGFDAVNAAKLRKQQGDDLKRFRDNLRAAMKWDYDEAKSNGFNAGSRGLDRYRKSPPSAASKIEMHLRMIEMSKLDTISVIEGTDLQLALLWEPPTDQE